MQSLVRNFEGSLDASFGGRDTHAALECLKIAAAAGGRWRPNGPYQLRCFRRAIGKAPEYSAVQWLNQLINCGVIDQRVFAEVMKTPRMKQVLQINVPGVVRLRDLAKPRTLFEGTPVSRRECANSLSATMSPRRKTRRAVERLGKLAKNWDVSLLAIVSTRKGLPPLRPLRAMPPPARTR
jgi:hypothetical protein